MNILSLAGGLVKLAASFFSWLRDFQIFQAGRTAAERDNAEHKLAKLDKARLFRDRVKRDPAYVAELYKRYGEFAQEHGLPSSSTAEAKPNGHGRDPKVDA